MIKMKKLTSLLIFAKAPIKGFVKTRLHQSSILDETEVLNLYVAFLQDIIRSAEKTSSERIYLSCYPKEGEHLMYDVLKRGVNSAMAKGRFSILPQEGKDFDERFTNAVETALKGSRHVIVIGSDSPHIQPSTIDRAHKLLDKKGGLVLGPSTEGGAYLVGAASQVDFRDVFTRGVELDNLTDLAMEQQMPISLLEELTDIDVESDLISFICRIKAMEAAAKSGSYALPLNTIQAIRDIGLVVDGKGGARGRRLVKI